MRVLHRELRAAILDGRLKPGLRLPSTRILGGIIEADDMLAALTTWPLSPDAENDVRVSLPPGEGTRPDRYRTETITDRRDWIAGVHAGQRQTHVWAISKTAFTGA